MLKALELTGFKSFADRTRFDFPSGITVVVGPNGSGKSNIVDAIKWVLGAQSAKSLRGSDMADVIFKGSAVGGRKPANSAEATLVFDNADSRLAIDAPEVHVTRRVYRSGESEYLINSQPCRLKDIKDLFRGTGVGVDSYSLIEQGKVERMLQASPKDRRAIFEEAAGISRFKAKKVEAERRLARVDQNLLRLNDIVEEVRLRYESLQNQATKARKYREMTQRLSVLRTQIGLADAATLTQSELSLRQSESHLIDQQQRLRHDLQLATQELIQVEEGLAERQRTGQADQKQQFEIRSNIASLESTQHSLRERMDEWNSERSLLQTRLLSLRQRAVLTGEEVERLQGEIASLDDEHRLIQFQLTQWLDELGSLENDWKLSQLALESQRSNYLGLMRLVSEQKSIATADQQLAAQLLENIQSKSEEISSLRTLLTVRQSELQHAVEQSKELQQSSEAKRREWAASNSELDRLRRCQLDRQDEAMALQSRLQAIGERLRVLQELEQQLEGVGHGAKSLLELSHQRTDAPWNTVRGLVADLIEIDVHLAPLVDVALDSAAETVVLDDGQIIQNLRDGTLHLDGRISLLRLDRLSTRRSMEKMQLDGLRGVIGRADRLVRCSEEFQPLVKSLLGTTWLVDSLGTAIDLSHLRGAGLRFVTAACERIEADGTLTLGALKSALGLVARRSEMQAAKDEISHHRQLVEQAAHDTAVLNENISHLSAQTRELDEQARQADQQAMAAHEAILRHQQQFEHCQQELLRTAHELDELQHRHKETIFRVQLATQQVQQLECDSNESLRLVELEKSRLRDFELQRREQADRVTTQRVVLAKYEQRLESHRATLEQWTRDHVERHQAVLDAIVQLDLNRNRFQTAELQLLDASSILAEQFRLVENYTQRIAAASLEFEQFNAQRLTASKQVDSCQRLSDRNRDRQSQLTNELAQLATQRQQLHQRFQDDYQLDLTDPELAKNIPLMEDRDAAESESAKLRQDIAQVGAVNMEALRELDELQARFDYLSSQQQDLIDARDALLKIIVKINQDSRRLFLETLEAIRQNFQVLYRKSFGGGHADIVLEEGEDVLECGVEVIATPPGKTALSNSLLSGGEKALTAVALIMAIFQFRPSPFCVLDEVDAPFDEANIGRFVSVLKEFLDWTKFIVVTHSKKTMTAANTLYGVTMQESGVSTQVSVRFEDVDDQGNILRKAA